MRKTLILVAAALLAIAVIGVVFAVAFFGRIQMGEPQLRIELDPTPPWHATPNNTLEVGIEVANDAWLLAFARDVRVIISTPEGFTSLQTGPKEQEIKFGTLHGGQTLRSTFSIKVVSDVPHGNYTLTIRLLGENIRERILTPQVIVQSPVFIP